MRTRMLVVLMVLATGCAVPAGSQDRSVTDALDDAIAAGAAEEAEAGAVSGERGQSDPAAGVADAGPVDRSEDAAGGDEPAPASDAGTTPGSGTEPQQEAPASVQEPEPLEFEVNLSATCVAHGDEVTIEVVIEPDASVAYHAVYAGEEGGAVPPYGEGHGGNDAAPAGAQGRYVDTWVVGPRAPVGPARVDVVVAYYGARGKTEVAFEVADRLTGTCGNA
jgi:hypothetical protein